MIPLTEPVSLLIVAAATLAALVITARATLQGWNGWLALRRLEIESLRPADTPAMTPAGSRIEIAALKERIRKLEAIAAGVDL